MLIGEVIVVLLALVASLAGIVAFAYLLWLIALEMREHRGDPAVRPRGEPARPRLYVVR
jgi:hypothetical protein